MEEEIPSTFDSFEFCGIGQLGNVYTWKGLLVA